MARKISIWWYVIEPLKKKLMNVINCGMLNKWIDIKIFYFLIPEKDGERKKIM